ncbi:DUF551 domain-containing protein [Roseomonas chloroacetimidivorans]
MLLWDGFAVFVGFWNVDHWATWEGLTHRVHTSHWMPLPTPPAGGAGGAT